MKAKDLAWLASVVAESKLLYVRKDEVVNELQALFASASKREIPSITLEVKTSWQEEQDKKSEKDEKDFNG